MVKTVASSKWPSPTGPWYLDHDGNVVVGTPGQRNKPACALTKQDVMASEIVEVFGNITEELSDENWNELQWERIRNAWVEFALKLAEVKLASQKAGVDESDDEYQDLGEIRVDNFDDAMKILSRNFLY